MTNKALSLLGLMRKANAIAVGEDSSGDSARKKSAKLILVASNASDNAHGRAHGFAAMAHAPMIELPFTKDEISAAVGKRGCSMAAINDLGFAEALIKLLQAMEPEKYDDAAAYLAQKRQQGIRHDNKTVKRRTNV